ncbi:hypothetical protein J437_LFUL013854, partial [Ladona fulva]
MWDMIHQRSKVAYYLIIQIITVNIQPYSIPSNDGANYVSLATDIWTATSNDFQQERAVLRIAPFEGSHTLTRISNQTKNVLKQYYLTRKKIFLALRDSESNLRKLQWKESAAERNIVTHFDHSLLAVRKLKDLHEKLGLQKPKLIQDVPASRNSTYYLLEGNLEKQKSHVTYTVDSEIPKLSHSELSLVEKIVLHLKSFEEIALEMGYHIILNNSNKMRLNLFLFKAR